MLYFIIAILILGWLATLVYIFLLKRNTAYIFKQLQYITTKDTNAQINQLIHDKSTTNIIILINTVLEQAHRITIESRQFDADIKQTITNVTHDLRTPLTVANGYLQLLKDTSLTPTEKETYLKNIEMNLQRLTEQLQILFEYAKIQENKIETNYSKFNISELFIETVFPYYDEFTNRNIDVTLDIEERITYIGDAEMIKRIFQNIIGNILAHGKETATFSLHKKDNQIEIITKNKYTSTLLEVEKVFNRFYTEDFARTNKNTGLGLAIVKEFVDLHDGTSTASIVDDYFTILITLPLQH